MVMMSAVLFLVMISDAIKICSLPSSDEVANLT